MDNIYSLVNAVYQECKYMIWPYVCACCKMYLRSDTLVCTPCVRTITPVISVPLSITPTVSMQVYAISGYQGALKRLILAKAFHDERASIVLGKLLWHTTTLPYIPFDSIVPIPLHWTRYAQRGYNQAQLIAQELSVLSGKPLCLALERTQATVFQSTLKEEDRKKNVKEAFAVTQGAKEHLRGKRVLLVDDLMTSGATLSAAGKLILQCKPESIKGAVAGRVL